MIIKQYSREDEAALFELIQNEGGEWKGYTNEVGKAKYKIALENSIVYIAYEDNVLCAYCRCRNDDGFGIYIYDLLVDKKYRGRQYGRMLMTQVYSDFSEDTVYVMSDVEEYYEKQGYQREGSIFEVGL